MWRICYQILVAIFVFARVGGFSLNNTAELISTYAKVAHWGSSKSQEEARSSGQSLWTHRSDANVRGGQNLKKQPVTYYYSMRVPTSKVDDVPQETIPSKGEVLQERFNPRPYFDFVFDKRPDPPKSNGKQNEPPKSNPNPPPSVVYGTPVNSFQGFDSAPVLPTPPPPPPPSEIDSKPPSDVYSSPFSSYNPPDFKPGDSEDGGQDFPPNQLGPPDSVVTPPSAIYGVPLPPPSDTYGSPTDKPNDNGKRPQFHPPLAVPPPPPPKKPDSYYGPPPPLNEPDSSYYVPPPDKGNSPMVPDMQYGVPPGKGHGDNAMPPSMHYGPPPDKANGDDSAPPPDKGPGDDSMHYGPPPDKENGPPSMAYGPPPGNGNGNHDHGPPISQTVMPPGPAEPPYLDHPPTDNDYRQHDPHHPPPQSHSMAEDDLSPPPQQSWKIPQYLDHEPNDHDFYHLGHDVYHEIKHTTAPPPPPTTAAPRAGPYSYYYLGRKLWYIPLYFSVYFICYVTVLILKSIARHKIQFSHNFDNGRSARELDVDSLNQTVATAIEDIRNKYM